MRGLRRLRWALAAAPPAPILPLLHADRAVLRQALSGVDTRPQAPPSSYLRDLLVALIDRVAAWWGMVKVGPAVGRWFAYSLIAVVALSLVLIVLRIVRQREAVRRRSAAPAAGVTPVAELPTWGAEEWRRERIRALAEGRLSDALLATWWWLARSVAGARAEAAWTGRDLLAASRRSELRRPIRELEALRYGPGTLRAEPVQKVVNELEATLT